MRVLIVDDEQHACRRLERAIGTLESQIEVLGHAHDGEQARLSIAQLKPDIIFLDIEMPGVSGLSLAQEIADTLIVFVTAHEQYALPAFEVDAVDYLLKPVTSAALSRAIERCVRRLAGKRPAESSVRQRTPCLRATFGNRTYYLDIERFDRFCGAGKYTAIWDGDREYLVEVSLSAIENSLAASCPGEFLRVHRSELIRLAAIKCLCNEKGGYEAELQDGQRAAVSRRCLARLRQTLALRSLG